ncbi:MAG: MmgE/PrpD family protein [Deltaproteobacteria bacterium]|nr:MmgE/PrpD family protein [Deltaproteobacteria bacterium]
MKKGGPIAEQNVMSRLSAYIAAARDRWLPEAVVEKAKHHILDTVAAMVSGSRLKPGQLAIKFIRTQGGTPEAQIIGADFLTTAINAAMTNGFMAHADETDDSHAPSLTHPGCAIVPAALAVAERENASGEAFLRAVVLGYDISSRIARAMSIGPGRIEGHATHAIGPLFGATAAAASLGKLNPRQVFHAMAYAAQQASGITSWPRDEEHVEKAFVFAGMGARNGVTSALFAQYGFTGEDDVFSGANNFLEIFCPARDELPKWIDNLGSHYEILVTNIKKFCVGSPIQAAAEAMTALVREHRLTADKVKRIDVNLPPQGAQVVNNRNMPDINCQYIMAVILLDGQLTFKAAHTYERMGDPRVLEVQARVNLIGDPQFSGQERQRPGLVRVNLANGQTVEKLVPSVRGTADNPMTREEVEAKSLDLLQDVLGTERAKSLIRTIWELDKVESVRNLRPLLSA